MEAKEKVNLLKLIRNDIGEESFRTAVAHVYSEFYINQMTSIEKKVRKVDVWRYVNAILLENGSKELSYSYYKKKLKL